MSCNGAELQELWGSTGYSTGLGEDQNFIKKAWKRGNANKPSVRGLDPTLQQAETKQQMSHSVCRCQSSGEDGKLRL